MRSLLAKCVSAWENPAKRTWALCLALNFYWACYLGASVITLFYTDIVGFALTIVLLLPAWLHFVAAASEMRSGFIADRIGQKRAMLYGISAQLVQSLALAFWARSFIPCLLVVTINALSWSLTNGTTVALMDSLELTGAQKRRYKFHQTCAQHAGQLISALVGGWLVSMYGLAAPIMAQPVPFVLALITVFFIPKGVAKAATVQRQNENAEQRKADKASIRFVRQTLFRNPAVRWLLLLDASLYAVVTTASWLVQPDIIAAGVDEELLPAIFLVQVTVGFVLALFAVRIADRVGDHKVQLMMTILVTGSVCLAGLPFIGWYGSAMIYAACAVHRVFSWTLASHAISSVRKLNNHRATAQSVNGALRAAVYVPMFFLGKLAEAATSNAALLCLGVFAAISCGYSLKKYLYALRL